MKFIEPQLETILIHLDQLNENTPPIWGKMNAIQMVEHLTDVLQAAQEKIKVSLVVPEEKLDDYQKFMLSDKPIPKGSEAPYPKRDTPRNENLDLAIDEFAEEWVNFEDFFMENPKKTSLHPYFGQLDYKKWLIMHAKHITHHLTQFGIAIA